MTLSIGAATAGLPALLERGGSRVEPRTRAAAGGDVAPVRTRLTLPQATACLGTAWYRVFGEQAPPQAIALLAGQWAHETGNGASMYNYNFGGIKGVGPSGLSVSQRTKEGWGENERSIVDRFRAYGSAEEGAEDYVRLLAKRYGGAIEAARQGDADEFVHQLKARGYFTGNEQVYAVSVRRLANQALDSIGEPALDLRALPELPILRVAEAAVADRRRSKWSRAVDTGLDLDEQSCPARGADELLDLRRAAELLDRALAGLDEQDRAIYIMAELEQLSRSEVAEALAIPKGTVASRLRRAREAFEAAVRRLHRGARS